MTEAGGEAGRAMTEVTQAHGARLRLARQARGLSQQQLAGVAGVTRQAVSAVESGHSDPSLRVALALASALGMTVEALFGPGDPADPVLARPVAAPSRGGARVVLATVGDTFVALPLHADMAARVGFGAAGGLVVGASSSRAAPVPDPASRGLEPIDPVEVRPIGPPRPTLVVAGCDPALPLLEAPLGLLDPPVAFTWWPCSSREALALAAEGLVHVAGTHLRGQDTEYNIGPAAEMLPRGGEVIGFCAWQEGLLLRPDLADDISGVSDLAERGLRLVNREPGAEARSLLDRKMSEAGIEASQLPGYDTQVTGHLQVAAAIAAGLADAGIASEPAARAYGLAFIPLAAEHFDLVIPAGQFASREVQGLLKILSSAWLVDQLANLPGYDPARCGERIATIPRRQQPVTA
jgi:molybdate-binding protein/DNA-binding XRE family transcriptional regulator